MRADSETKTNLEFQTSGGKFSRKFAKKDVHPFDEINWTKKDCIISNPDGSIVFESRDLEVPTTWSQLALDIAASKYFKRAGVPITGGEKSVKQMVYRVAHTFRAFGERNNYFDTKADADAFEEDLIFLLVNQYAAFNSPVWFNVGLHEVYGIKGKPDNFFFDPKDNTVKHIDTYEKPQCSACFIQSLEDDLDAIFELVKSESRLFKYGSGTGTNFSKLRGKGEKLSGGGSSSGLISFLEVLDRGAGATKSGGITRRAAKMVMLDMDHPDIEEFITWKTREEDKALALIRAGYPSDFNGEAYKTVSGQNSNNSVRIPHKFMTAYLNNEKWQTTFRTNGKLGKEYDAVYLMNQIAHSAWRCADPGVQFDDTMNEWHTCSNTDKIRATNPCSEYNFLDDTACNLASLNLMKFLKDNGEFDVEKFRNAVKIIITAQEIAVELSSYPTAPIAKNSYDFRPLGLGYANLGTMLMVSGIPYDSDKGRAIAGAITAIMTGHAYKISAEIAAKKGAFNGFEKNREPMLKVMNKHRDAVDKINPMLCPQNLLKAAEEDWNNAILFGEKFGYRNSQATVLAPTGTIGLLMDCDTTGVEPEFALVKWKKLAGGGYFKIVNSNIPKTLAKLGYNDIQIKEMIDYVLGFGTLEGCPFVNVDALKSLGLSEEQIKEAAHYIETMKALDDWTPHINPKALLAKGLVKEQIKEAQIFIGGSQTLEGAPHIQQDHLAVFDCANKCGNGERFIAPMGHIKIMASVQPYISGAISKTVNIPNSATVEDIKNIYVDAWKLGLKCVALYRDGCKSSQPLSTSSSDKVEEKETTKIVAFTGLKRGEKKELPYKRHGYTTRTMIGGNKVFVRTGEYADGTIGEIFLDMHKEGAAFRGLLGCFSIAVSYGLQYGVPLEKYVDAFTFTRFEPSGRTDHPYVKSSTSIVDFVFRILALDYLGRTDLAHVKPEVLADVGGIKLDYATIKKEFKEQKTIDVSSAKALNNQMNSLMGDAPPCDNCGHITVRSGSCYKCLNCGSSMGCS